MVKACYDYATKKQEPRPLCGWVLDLINVVYVFE